MPTRQKALSTNPAYQILGPPLNVQPPEPMEGPSVFSTGNFGLDYGILQIGGIPRGVITEFFGKEQSGKSTICLHIIKAAQKAGFRCAYFDAEGFLSTSWGQLWAQKIGVDLAELDRWDEVGPVQKLYYAIIRGLQEKLWGLVVVDSMASLKTQSQMVYKDEKEIGDTLGRIMDLANVNSQWMSQIRLAATRAQAAIVFTNQIRANVTAAHGLYKPGPIKTAARGEELTPGGKALRHAARLRLYLQRTDALYGDTKDEILGSVAEAMVVKSTVSEPFRRTGKDAPDIRFYFDGRLQDEFEVLLDYAKAVGLITIKGGGKYFGGATTLGTGKESLRLRFETEPDFTKWMRETVLAAAQKPISSLMHTAAEEEGFIRD